MALLGVSLLLLFLAGELAGKARPPAWLARTPGGVMSGSLAGDCLDPSVPGVPPRTVTGSSWSRNVRIWGGG